MTRFTYDASGNVTSFTDPLGNVRTFTYDPTFNKVTSLTDPLGNLTTFEYDANGNLIATSDPEQNRKPEGDRLKTRIGYNQFGQPTATTDPVGDTTTFTYDSLGNLTAITDPLGSTTQRSYDTVSRLLAQRDPLGKTTRFSYDALNRLVSIVDAVNGVTGFSYDPNGNLLTVTDARGSLTTHTYDSMDRLATRTHPLGRQEAYQYDATGNLTQFADRKNQITMFTYDPLNRRTRSTYADVSFTELAYDAAGRLLTATDSLTGTITEEYDIVNRLVREATPQGTIQYAYDPVGRRTTMTVNGQSPVSYTYDAASRLTQILQAPLNPVSIQYDAAGRRTLLTLPNAVSTAYDYDGASRLTRLAYSGPAGVLGDLTYQYDSAGNRVAVGGSFARTLLPDAIPTATYDAANQQSAFGNKIMTYDQNGNLVAVTEGTATTTFTWDARNRLVTLGGATPGSFAYDAQGRRITKTINGVTTTFHYDGANIVQLLDSLGTTSYLRSLNIDEALSFTNRDGTYFSIYDPLGSTVAILDSTAMSVVQYTYVPFGTTSSTNPTFPNPFQFSGRENDGTGLLFYRSRYYSPQMQKFISEDQFNFITIQMARQDGSDFIGDTFYRGLLMSPSLWHAYNYVSNNPVTRIDPFGFWFVDVGGGIAVPLVPVGVGVAYSMQIGPDGIFLTGGLGFGIGGAFGATYFPEGSPSEGISARVTAQGAVTLPPPLPPIPVGAKVVYSIDEHGNESLRVGYGVGFGVNVSFTPVTQTKCIARCNKKNQTVSKSSR